MSMRPGPIFQFEEFRLDVRARSLRRKDEIVPLNSRAFDVLVYLVQNPGKVLSRDGLLKNVWEESFVDENSLAQSISALRRALDEKPGDKSYIVTLPGRGYQFVAAAVLITSEVGNSLAEAAATNQSDPSGLIFQKHTIQTSVITEQQAKDQLSLPIPRKRPLLGPGLVAALVLVLTSLAGFYAWKQSRRSPTQPAADSLSRDTLGQLHKNLNSGFIVLGSYTALGAKPDTRVRLDLRLQDTAGGETIADVAGAGREAELFDMVSQAGSRLREKLGVEAISPVEAVSVRASLPSNREAARLYSEGLARLRVLDASEARDLLQRAMAADPKFSLAHSALAEAWSRLGYDQKAQQEARQAYDLAVNLSPAERLVVEGRYRDVDHEHEKAIQIYRTLFRRRCSPPHAGSSRSASMFDMQRSEQGRGGESEQIGADRLSIRTL